MKIFIKLFNHLKTLHLGEVVRLQRVCRTLRGLAGLLIIFSGCVKNVEIDPITPPQWKVFSYFPGDTQFVLYMNLNELRKTEFWESYFEHSLKQSQKNKGELDINDWLTEFEGQTGVGLNDGVSEIYMASTWMGNNIIAVSFDKNLEKVSNYFRDNNKFERIQKGERDGCDYKSRRHLGYRISGAACKTAGFDLLSVQSGIVSGKRDHRKSERGKIRNDARADNRGV